MGENIHETEPKFRKCVIKRTVGPSEHAIRNMQPLAEQRKKQRKFYGLGKENITQSFIYLHESHFFKAAISKGVAVGEEPVAGEDGGSLPDDLRFLLETPG